MSTSFGLTPALIRYLAQNNPPEHSALTACREATAKHTKAVMQISAEQGAFMDFLIRLIDARLAVEVGVFTGYSALVTALALRANAGPGARLFALDISTEFTDLAKPYWAAAQVQSAIDLRIAPASESLQALCDEGYENRIDFIFVDADKTGYLDYYELGLRLLHPGGLMLFDNVLWSGAVADPSISDPETDALRALGVHAHADVRTHASMIGVGDGLLLVRKL